MSEHIQLNDYEAAIKTIHHSNKHHLAANRNQKLDICISPSNDIIITSKRYRDKTACKTHFTSGSVCSLLFSWQAKPFCPCTTPGGRNITFDAHTHKHKKGNRKATLFPHHTHTHTLSPGAHTSSNVRCLFPLCLYHVPTTLAPARTPEHQH